jgi:DNA-binding transcriptional ArsR family regulator
MTQINKRKNSARAACCQGMADVLGADLFKALSDSSRLDILVRLAEADGSRTVSQVAELGSTDVSVVSRHLVMLKEAGVVEAEKKGREVHYAVRYRSVAEMLRAMADSVEACCPGADSGGDSGGEPIPEETEHGRK